MKKKKLNFQKFIFRLLFYVSVILIIFISIKLFNNFEKNFNYLYYYFICSFIIFFYFLFILIKKYSEYFFIITISILISFYIFEFYYVFKNINNEFQDTYEKKEYDKNILKLNFYNQNKENDNSTIIGFNSLNYFKSSQKLLPLTHASNSNIIGCNEDGFYSKFISDKYGFNNPNDVWEENKKNIILLGDSFVEGSCVFRKNNIVSNIQKLNSNFNFINLGIGGTSIISQYAILKEFIKKNTVQIFLFYYEGNDLNEIKIESKNQILLNYLKNPNFTQNLKENTKVSDEIIRNNFEIEKKIFLQKKIKFHNHDFQKNIKKKISYLSDAIKLKNSRKLLTYLHEKKTPQERRHLDKEIILYKNTLLKIKTLLDKENIELVFVYLPEFGRYDTYKYYKYKFKDYSQYHYRKILEILKKENIRHIDIHQLIFLQEKDPLDCFPQRQPGHYNAKCYFKISEILNKFIVK